MPNASIANRLHAWGHVVCLIGSVWENEISKVKKNCVWAVDGMDRKDLLVLDSIPLVALTESSMVLCCIWMLLAAGRRFRLIFFLYFFIFLCVPEQRPRSNQSPLMFGFV